MIGVILWSDRKDRKAVIWCEDQGDLAFMSRPDAVCLPDTFVGVGDIVEFEVRTERSMRLAQNPSLVAAAQGAGLVSELKAMQSDAVHPTSTSAEIIPFRLFPPLRDGTAVACRSVGG